MSSGIFNKYTGYHNRKSIRLRAYDYARAGYYFVTICVHDREQNVFGDVVHGKMVENENGAIVRGEWHKTGMVRPNVVLDEFAVMPNHVHGIIHLTACRGTACRAQLDSAPDFDNSGTARRAPTGMNEHFGKPTVGTLPTIIRAFKSATSKRIHELNKEFKWQRDYYEHIVRDEKSLFLIRKYIHENPVNWSIDTEDHIAREIREFAMAETQGK